MIPPSVLVDNSDPAVTFVMLNRPDKRNALSIELIERLTEAVRAAGDDRNRRALVLWGGGPSFCAGLDLAEASEPDKAHRSAEALAGLYVAICLSPLVTIAAPHGAAFGGGAGLLLACDLVIATEDLEIGFPEVRRGLVAALVTCLLRRHLGDRASRELILLGQSVNASRALSLGLINRAVPTKEMGSAALALAREACRGAPEAIVRSKRLLDELAPRPIEQDLQHALKLHLSARQSAEAAEGIAAFREKREPRWGPRGS